MSTVDSLCVVACGNCGPHVVCVRCHVAGDFDYGGAAFMGPLLQNYNVSAPRELLKVDGKYALRLQCVV